MSRVGLRTGLSPSGKKKSIVSLFLIRKLHVLIIIIIIIIIIIMYLVHDYIKGIGIATGWTARVRFPAVQDFLFTASRPALGPTKPPIQWVTGALSPGGKAAGS
jgi:uncharacterized membrane protein